MPRRAAPLPRSVLFCCDQNALRSPMAEGIARQVVEPFELIVALSPDAADRILDLRPGGGLEVWDNPYPASSRAGATPDAYRETRDATRARLAARFGG